MYVNVLQKSLNDLGAFILWNILSFLFVKTGDLCFENMLYYNSCIKQLIKNKIERQKLYRTQIAVT